MSDFDLAVVGGGPGGYVAAERAAARGLKTVLVERDHLGGVCLNTGCIPTKTLIHSAKLLQQARGSAAYGVTVSEARYDFAAAMAWKSAVTERLRGGVAGQMERHGVTVERGTGMLTGRGRLTVDGRELSAGNVIVATGSRAVRPPIAGADLPHVVDSTGALQLRELPGRVVIVGGGYIGMEFACYFHAVGCEVVVVELLDDVLAGVDGDIVRQLKSALAGVAWHLGARVSAITAAGVAIVTAEGEREEAADTGAAGHRTGAQHRRPGTGGGRGGVQPARRDRGRVPAHQRRRPVRGGRRHRALAARARRLPHGRGSGGRHRVAAARQQQDALPRRAVGGIHVAGDRRRGPVGGDRARRRAQCAGGAPAAGRQRALSGRAPGARVPAPTPRRRAVWSR